ncbi:OmpW family protein [Flavobacterium salilacus subsp. salilacus]|uniref:OmpW/AlkL family protein n=1 Tax=Flavobacterium TaxID=237 RepID=UPI001074A408|nr:MULTISPECIES: OmpW family outer membrane protein [Flavobacterium]KAF2516284.1 OmpW family protein [Flavobacterium salilacus subsp. salilacus]MBE1613814.1 OmpW family protein [Flavobacterium sp. SaA2.13]
MKKIVLALSAMALLLSGSAIAQENNDNTPDFKKWQMRVRGVGVIPDESADIGIIGGDVDISTSLIPEVDFTYFFTKNIAAELILGTTKHDVHTTGSDISAIGGPTSADVDLGSVCLLPPTLTVQYHFYANETFKPYVGAGVNYTIFYNVDEGSTVRDVEYDNALGYAFQVGFDVMLNDKFFINMDVKKIFLSTDVTVDGSNLAEGLSIPAEVDINPLLVGFGVGMKF